MENYLIFQSVFNIWKRFIGTETIVAWESKDLSPGSIGAPVMVDYSLCSKIKWIHDTRIVLEFKRSCLNKTKQYLLQEMQWVYFLSTNYILLTI